METTGTPIEVNASGDYIRSLKFPAKSGTVGMTSTQTGDRLEAFYHRLKGAEGTLRAWNNRSQADKLTYIAALARPAQEKHETVAEFTGRFEFWRTALLGTIEMEVLSDSQDMLVIQAAVDGFRLPKTGKR